MYELYEKSYAVYDAREIAMTFHFFSDFASFDFWWSYLNLLNGAAIIDLVMIVKSDLEKCEIVVITLVVRQLVIFLLKWQYFNWIFLKRARVRHVHCPVFFQSKFFNQSFGDESAQYPKEFFHQRAAKMFSITLRISSGYQLTFQSDELLSVCQTVLLFKGLYVLKVS